MKACRKCLIDERVPDVFIDSGNVCDYCSGRRGDDWESRFHVTGGKKAALFSGFEDYLESIRGRHPYDLVLSLSGGKDSSYLLKYLTVQKKMKVLGINVSTPFESKKARTNLNRLKNHFDFELLVIAPGREFFRRFYSGLFAHVQKEGYIKSVCDVCNPFIHGKCLQTAVEKDIPLVVCGAAPGQPYFMFYELPESELRKNWIPDFFHSPGYDDYFMSRFWNVSESPQTPVPRLLAPLHVMDYNAESIRKELADGGIIPYKDSHPAVTNCILVQVMMVLDIRRNGINPFLKDFAAMVRRGESSRAMWKFLFTLQNWLVKRNLFSPAKIRYVESVLGINLRKKF
ncbi:MAG: hypothetical protein JXB88_10035 [Spirochaetales bacterium]|nr:hypothetical protein [Spirochaetales bacterium]